MRVRAKLLLALRVAGAALLAYLLLWPSVPISIKLGRISTTRCYSAHSAFWGGWQPIASAPRDGTPIETLETYGVLPWRRVHKWATFAVIGKSGGSSRSGYIVPLSEPSWVSVEDNSQSVFEDECLFWRPVAGTPFPDFRRNSEK